MSETCFALGIRMRNAMAEPINRARRDVQPAALCMLRKKPCSVAVTLRMPAPQSRC
ncbi:hypothetical protein [Paenibacillus sp. S150]|uniref:hypothetical protein n=1 Tax=Paenibacillus sp. S150 TaxID=2749826 RepID=UPI001C59E27F|nr:hypothetical protein [Paenibacillus sp. S150]MBW4085289.1 hypothetical protein [Paenibacillus sp. S150]